jgi:hypothetical protein
LVADSVETTGLKYVADTTNYAVGAKGDLLAGTAADTVAALAVGNDGETLVADSSTSTGLRYQGIYAAGKNKIINGDFSIWQRGTSFSSIANGAYSADRWRAGVTGDVVNITRQSFTPNDIASIGYGDAEYFLRMEVVSSDGEARIEQRIENVRTLADQTITVSYWAKANTSTNLDIDVVQAFGSGGSTGVAIAGTTQPITTSWARYSQTFTVPSISGKTIGTGSYLRIDLKETTASTNVTFDFWGVQVEAGSVATAFQTATGTIQGELAACQRYYWRATSPGAGNYFGVGFNDSTTVAAIKLPFPVVMRISPSALEQSGTAGDYGIRFTATGNTACSAVPTFSFASTYDATVLFTVASGLTGGQSVMGRGNNSSAFLGWSAEL